MGKERVIVKRDLFKTINSIIEIFYVAERYSTTQLKLTFHGLVNKVLVNHASVRSRNWCSKDTRLYSAPELYAFIKGVINMKTMSLRGSELKQTGLGSSV